MNDAKPRHEERMCVIPALVKVGWLPSGGIKSMGKTAQTHTEIIITPISTHDAVRKPEGWTLSRRPTRSMRNVAASR
jgi:hypothetical protein